MKIYFEEEHVVTQEILDTMMKAAEICIDAENIDVDRSEISVTFVDMEEIHQLNLDYRGVDSPTDVLSFPQFDDLNDLPEDGEIALGDVVICKQKAEEQAEEFGHSFEREIMYLFVHSVLHLLGYDHMDEDEKKIMRRREEEVMAELGITREDA